jgi:hypothetical protein
MFIQQYIYPFTIFFPMALLAIMSIKILGSGRSLVWPDAQPVQRRKDILNVLFTGTCRVDIVYP